MSEQQATDEKDATFMSLHAIARRLHVEPKVVTDAVEGKVMLAKFQVGGHGLPLVRLVEVQRLLGR